MLCIGGSWLVPADALESGDYARITELARSAVSGLRCNPHRARVGAYLHTRECRKAQRFVEPFNFIEINFLIFNPFFLLFMKTAVCFLILAVVKISQSKILLL